MPQKENPNYILRCGLTALQRANINPGEGIIEGYPIVFNERTAIGDWFYEEIDPRSLDDADLSDIKFLVNHDDRSLPLARHRRGARSTMDISVDERGLSVVAHLDRQNNVNAQMLLSAVERGDITDMSFAFGLEIDEGGDEWSDIMAPMPIRRITKIRKVYDVSAVNDGAYPQTSIAARSGVTLENEKRMLDNIRARALDNEKSLRLGLDIEKFLFLEERRK